MVRRFLAAAGLIGMSATAGAVLDRVYTGDLLLYLVAGAATGAVLVSLLALRLPGWTVAPLSAFAMAGYVLLATARSAASGGIRGTPVDLAGAALRDAVPRLLSALVPVEPQPDTVLVPVIAAWLGGLVAAELALRAGRGLAACAPPVALFAGALVLVGRDAAVPAGPALVFAGCAAVVLAATRNSTVDGAWARAAPAARLSASGRSAAGAVLAAGGVIALAAATGPLLATRVTRAPADVRRDVVPPRLDTLDENPLVRLSGWALTPQRPLLSARVPGATGPVRIRLAVMGDYDGVTWRVGGVYRDAGRVLPAPSRPGPGTTRRPLRQEITVSELEGRLLPAAATPRRIAGVRVAYDQRSGTVMVPGGLRSGLKYTVDSDVSTVDVNLLPGLNVPAGPAVARFLALGPAVPPELSRLATQLGEGTAAPYQRALAIEQFLAEHYKLVADAPSGHAYPNLMFFLFGPRHGGGQRGTTEQFAASFAVLARALGLPTRVVLGFTARPGTDAVLAADALAWPEVLFDEVGWVPFNPLPQSDAAPRPVEEDFRPSPPPSASPPPPVPPPSASPLPSTSPVPAAPPARQSGSGSHPLLLTVAGTGAAAVAYLIGIPLLRRTVRRRRLTAADPAVRIAGAWREVIDGLRLAGMPAPPHLTATEVADHAAERQRIRPAAPGHGRHTARPRGTGRLDRPLTLGYEVHESRRPAHLIAHRQWQLGGGPDPTGMTEVHDLARLANAAAFGPRPGGKAAARANGAATARASDEATARTSGAAANERATGNTAAPALSPGNTAARAPSLGNTATLVPRPGDEVAAARATEVAVSFVDSLRARRSWWARLRWWLDPRPLWWTRR